MAAISSGSIHFSASITSSFLSLGFFLILRLLNASEKVDEGIVGFLRIEVAHISLGGGEIAVGQQLFNVTAVKLGFFCNFGGGWPLLWC